MRKKSIKDDPEQSKRFEETAKRILDADQQGDRFDDAMDAVLTKRKSNSEPTTEPTTDTSNKRNPL